MFMFLLLYRVCTHVELGVLATGLCVYVCVGLEGMYTCKISCFGNNHLCLCYLLLYRVCTNVRLGVLEMSACVYVFWFYRVCTYVRLVISGN